MRHNRRSRQGNLDTPPTVNDLARLLADGMSRLLIETAHRPSRMALRGNPLWQEILPHLKELKSEVVLQDTLPEWDRMLANFAREQGKRGGARDLKARSALRNRQAPPGGRRTCSVQRKCPQVGPWGAWS
jgi:hypothetical protein